MILSSASRTFYDRLAVHADFARVTDPRAYADVPEDWAVALADVRGSTRAIAEGRYKAVNMVGASVIVALLNLDRAHEWPFVFGGDGAAVLLPPDLAEAARRALLATRQMAAAEFELDLRVGLVPVARLHAAGHTIRVARFRLAPGYDQAMFLGGGLAHAEELLKRDPAVALDAPAPAEADFSGLECRWQDVPSRHGETIALVVVAHGDEAAQRATLRDALAAVEAAYGDAERCRPVVPEVLIPSYDLARLHQETRIRRHGAHALARAAYTAKIAAQNALLELFLARNTTTGTTCWPDYPPTLAATTDFRKVDGALRMVLSGTAEQRAALSGWLEGAHAAGRLAYGLHATDRAHLTCVVFERMGRQVHFVDAADGGYAMAARGLKAQLAALTAPAPPVAEA